MPENQPTAFVVMRTGTKIIPAPAFVGSTRTEALEWMWEVEKYEFNVCGSKISWNLSNDVLTVRQKNINGKPCKLEYSIVTCPRTGPFLGNW